MKVGFIGAGGTGKTTVANLLTDLGIPVMPSVARDVFKEQNLTEASQLAMTQQENWTLQKTIFDRKLRQDLDHEDRLTDRTLLDHFVYALLRSNAAMDDSTASALEALVKENLQKYDVLVYFPLAQFWNAADGFRQANRSWAMAVDAAQRGMLEKLGVPFKTMPFGSPESRAALVRQWIDEAKSGEKKEITPPDFDDLKDLKVTIRKLSLKSGDLLVVRALGTPEQQEKVAQQVRQVKRAFGFEKISLLVTDFSVIMDSVSREKLLEMGFKKVIR